MSITAKQFIGTVALSSVAVIGAFWALLAFTTGGVRDDVKTIRDSIVLLQTGEKDGLRRNGELDSKLAAELGKLHVALTAFTGQIAVFDTKLDKIDKAVGTLVNEIVDVRKQVAARQAAFTDPKTLDAFAARVNNLNWGDKNVVIVPLDSSATIQK